MEDFTDSQRRAAMVQAFILQATKLLQAGSHEEAYQATLWAKSLQTPVINLEMIRAACFINMQRLRDAADALQEELRLFPGNGEAQKLLDQLQRGVTSSGNKDASGKPPRDGAS